MEKVPCGPGSRCTWWALQTDVVGYADRISFEKVRSMCIPCTDEKLQFRTVVRVANELGAGNGKGAKFATIVSVLTSVIIGLFFWMLIMIFHDKFGYIFSTSKAVLDEVNKLSLLLAFTILLNSVQPVLSGVAVGSGWQSYVAYINLGCYYVIGVPLGFLMGWFFNQGVMGIWAGMIFGGTATQTLILGLITMRCDWDREAEKAKLHLRKWADPKQELS